MEWQCSFCGKRQCDTKQLIAGTQAYICDEFVDRCSEIRLEFPHDGRPEPDGASVMVCGMVHFAWRQDWRSIDVGDVRSDDRQREIHEVVERLAAFRATHVAVEQIYDNTVMERYRQFLSADIELGSSEVEQIGFRLARQHAWVLVAAGHRFLLYQFLRDSGRYQVVDVQPYLR